jgi:hypothetical protein
MAATETVDRVHTSAAPRTTRLIGDETKLSLKTTEFGRWPQSMQRS